MTVCSTATCDYLRPVGVTWPTTSFALSKRQKFVFKSVPRNTDILCGTSFSVTSNHWHLRLQLVRKPNPTGSPKDLVDVSEARHPQYRQLARFSLLCDDDPLDARRPRTPPTFCILNIGANCASHLFFKQTSILLRTEFGQNGPVKVAINYSNCLVISFLFPALPTRTRIKISPGPPY